MPNETPGNVRSNSLKNIPSQHQLGIQQGEAERFQVVKLQSENPEKLVTNALDNPKRHCIGFLKIRRVETENIPRQRTRTNHGSRYQSSRS
jgi:hypothetical protein